MIVAKIFQLASTWGENETREENTAVGQNSCG